jgi:mannose/cellobiose epimerase-like protein (N-acyl-D-glucosamine 2-epimerase family)
MTPDRIDAYLDKHLALWRGRGRDSAYGGFHERLDATGNPVATGYKRLLVQCRQVFAHSLGVELGFREGAEPAQQGFAFLRRHYRDEQNGGWYFSVTPEGKPRERQKDLYGHSFVLLAAAQLQKTGRNAEALKLAQETVEVLQQRFAPAVKGGFAESLTADWAYQPAPRLQNPHMHLLEGFLAIGRATGQARYSEHVKALVGLFRQHFFDAVSGTLGEVFDAAWRPDAERGAIVEPGHHFEWSWLLRDYGEFSKDKSALALADRLQDWAMLHGFDAERGGIFDEVDRAGAVLKASKRIWPLCECIKSVATQQLSLPSEPGRQQLTLLLDLLFERYLKPDGTWVEHFDRNWRPIVTEMPGSTSYHIVLALAEARRALA